MSNHMLTETAGTVDNFICNVCFNQSSAGRRRPKPMQLSFVARTSIFEIQDVEHFNVLRRPSWNNYRIPNFFKDWRNYGCAGEGLFDCATSIHGKQLDEFDRDFFQWKKCIQCAMSGASSSVWQNPSGRVLIGRLNDDTDKSNWVFDFKGTGSNLLFFDS